MPDLAFYNVGCDEPKGARRAVVASRRLLRRVLRPIFQRQVEILQSLCDRLDAGEAADRQARDDLASLAGRHEQVVEQVRALQALGWDHVAMARRLAVLEDRVEAMAADRDAREPRARVA